MSDNQTETISEVDVEDAEQSFEIPLEDFEKWYTMTRDELVAYIKENMSELFDIYTIKNPTGHALYLVRKDQEAKILAVGHIDTVIPHKDGRFELEEDDAAGGGKIHILHSPHNDDRQGIATIFEMFARHDIVSDILICDEEEVGRTTSRDWVRWRDYVVRDYEEGEDKDDFDDGTPTSVRQKTYNWAVEFDRRGTDVATYAYGRGWDDETKTFKSALEKHWGKGNTSGGSFTDICSLTSLGFKAFNVGIAYQNAHGRNGYFVVEQYAWAFINFINFYKEFVDTKFPHTESAPKKTTTYSSSSYKYTKHKTDHWGRYARNIHIEASPANTVWETIENKNKKIMCTVFRDTPAVWLSDDGLFLCEEALDILFELHDLERNDRVCEKCECKITGGIAKDDKVCMTCFLCDKRFQEDDTPQTDGKKEQPEKKLQAADNIDVGDEDDLPSLNKVLSGGGSIGEWGHFKKVTVREIRDFLVGDTVQPCSCCGRSIDPTEWHTGVVTNGGRFIMCPSCLDTFISNLGENTATDQIIAGTCLYCLKKTTKDYLTYIPAPHQSLETCDMVCLSCVHKYTGDIVNEPTPFVARWKRDENGKPCYINEDGDTVVAQSKEESNEQEL